MSTDRIEKSVFLRTTLTRAWRALADSKEFGTWFGVRFEAPFLPGVHMHGTVVPTQVDAEVAAAQKPYAGVPFEITIEQMVPERLFSFRWHPFAVDPAVDYSGEPTTLVEFVLEEAEGGVRLTMTETGFDGIPLERRARAFQANSGGWNLAGKLIEKYVAEEWGGGAG